MKVLLFISHPAQFLFFKNTIAVLKSKKHQVVIVLKTKDVLTKLVEAEGWDYLNILPKERKKNKWSIAFSLIKRNYKLFKYLLLNRVDLMMGTDASIAQVGKILRIPVITTLEDDVWVIKNLAKLTFPFTTSILVPLVCDVGKWKEKKIGYDGYMKLAYLHPNWFEPNIEKVKINNDSYCLIRLSGLSAHHDFGALGISPKILLEIIKKLETKFKVYISSEGNLPKQLESYRLKIKENDIHHYLYYANLFVCDSQSMAVESAILGTPNIRISSFAGKISVLEELEHKYGLTFGFNPNQLEAINEKIDSFLSSDFDYSQFKNRRLKMLNDKIDVTAMLIWIIENYPESIVKIKSNDNIFSQFK